MENGDDKRPELKIVSDNARADIEAMRARDEAEHLVEITRERAIDRMHNLAANLLRIIAGAGQPDRLLTDIDEARTTYIKHIQALKDDAHTSWHQLQDDVCAGLSIDDLFEEHDWRPQTEEEWRKWQADVDDPYSQYREERERIKRELRRSVLREVAARLAGIDVHSRRYGNKIDEAINRFFVAREEYRKRRDKPVAPNPWTASIAEEAITELRKVAREKEIAGLQPHQVNGLRVIASGSLERIDTVDGFTLDVLGRLGFLQRIKGKSGKRGWELTDDGRLAVEHHATKSTDIPK